MAIDTNVRVHLQGLITGGVITNDVVMGTVFSGWQPVQYMHLQTRTNSAFGLFGLSTAAGVVAKGATFTSATWESVQSMTYASGYGTWNAMGLVNGWAAYGGIFATPQFTKGSDGLVSFKGLIGSGVVTNGTTIFTLPVGYRPAEYQIFIVGTSIGAGSVEVMPDGRVISVATNAGWTSLDGLTFLAEQ